MKKIIQFIAIIEIMILLNNNVIAQVTRVGTNGGTSSDIVGLDNNASNIWDLNIRHDLAGHSINFGLNGNTYMTLDGATHVGYFGIGTTSPAALFHAYDNAAKTADFK